jgi:uncharacterized membrane protein YozB (DUF420 family)
LAQGKSVDYIQIIATISLGVQITVLFLLIGGFALKRVKKYRQHGITMTSALALHFTVILTWMIWSLLAFLSSSSTNLADILTIITLAHASVGITAGLLGVWIVSSWRLRANMQMCFAKKRVMLVTLTLWLIALSLGVILYLKVMQLF